MKKTRSLCILAILLVFVLGCAQTNAESPEIEDMEQINNNSFSCSFDGVKHRFVLDLPDEPAGAPLVVMLPGYGNTAESFRTAVHFEVEANACGYAVVYVTGAPDPNSPTSAVGWHSELGTDGNRDAEFLVSLTEVLQVKYSLDPKNAYVVGFSNGGLMAHRLSAEASDTFSAFVSVAGWMPKSVWNARKDSVKFGFFQITGEKDDAVPKNSDGSARYAKDPAIEDVMEYLAESNGMGHEEDDIIGKGSVLTKYSSAENSQQVWHLLVANGRHSWPSEQVNGINTNALILEFFEAQK